MAGKTEAALAATSCGPRRTAVGKRQVEMLLKPRQGRHRHNGPSVILMSFQSDRDSHFALCNPTAGAVGQMMTPATRAFGQCQQRVAQRGGAGIPCRQRRSKR